MAKPRRPWRDELAIIDRVMKAISGITDPEEMVDVYWKGVGDLVPGDDYVSVSRRGIDPPKYFITRSSRFKEHFNPWTQRDRLPRLTGGLLGEIAYADAPVIIDDLPSRLQSDDPAWEYLEGFGSLLALPQYDGGKGLNVSATLFPPGHVIDHELIPMLHWQAGLFGRGTQNLVLRNQLKSALSELDKEMQVVGEIQRSLLPQELPKLPGFEFAAHYRTSARAGGDYYDFFPLPDGQLGIFIADVSGHGTPAAVLMAITHAIAHTQPGSQQPPGKMLTHLNHHLAKSYTGSGTFVTAFYGMLNPRTRALTYSVAGHNPPRLVRRGAVLSVEATGGLPLGIMPDAVYGEASGALEPGDLLVLYTDGITEAVARGKQPGPRTLFGTERLDAILSACSTADAPGCIHRVRTAIEEFSGNGSPVDDQTLIAMSCMN